MPSRGLPASMDLPPVSFKVLGLFKECSHTMDHIGSLREKSANQGEPLVSVGQRERAHRAQPR